MKKLIPFLLLIIFIISGCKQVVMWKYGIRKPKQETAESITAYAKKHGQNPENIYILRDSVAFVKFLKDSVYQKLCFGALVFNEKGLVLNYKDTLSCQWSAGGFIGRLKKDTSYKVDETHKFPTVSSWILPLDPDAAVLSDARDWDYTVVFTWAKYLGQMNERLFRINEAASSNPDVNIRVISLNIDMQKSWGLRKEQQVRFN